MKARGPWLIHFDIGGMAYYDAVVWNAVGLSKEEVTAASAEFFGESDVEIDEVALAFGRHTWRDRNGFSPIDTDGEPHLHVEQVGGAHNATIATQASERHFIGVGRG